MSRREVEKEVETFAVPSIPVAFLVVRSADSQSRWGKLGVGQPATNSRLCRTCTPCSSCHLIFFSVTHLDEKKISANIYTQQPESNPDD